MPLQPPLILRTPRLQLRQVRLADAPAIFSEYSQDRDVTRYLTWKPDESLADTQAFLTGALKRWESGQEFVWAITLPPGDDPIGTISCRISGPKAELGYALSKRFWNRGLMSEAARAVSEWAINSEGIFRVWAYCDLANPQSARVMEKAGMQREGVLRRWVVLPNVSPEPRDCAVYSRVIK